MQLSIGRADLARVITSVARVVEARNTIPILSSLRLSADNGQLTVTGTDLDIVATASAPADITAPGAVCVDAKLLADIAKKAGGDIVMSLDGDRLTVKSGRSRFNLATLPADDFPSLGGGKYDAEFDIDLSALFAPVAFAISTEETRFYLNGVFFKGSAADYTAVATDGHRLARHVVAGGFPFEGIIVPRKLVGILPKGNVTVSVSSTKISIQADDLVLVSKLIDGTFPDYERVIPKNNEVIAVVDRDAMMKAADRVVTVSSQKGRSVKLSFTSGVVALAAHSDVGDASDEVAVDYDGELFEIGFNSQYLRDVFGVLPAGTVKMAMQEGGPAVLTGGLDGWDGVLMPVRTL